MIGLLMLAASSISNVSSESGAFRAYFANGKLLVECEARSMACASYLMGVADMLAVMNSAGQVGNYYCPVADTTLDQIRTLVLKNLRSHPKELEYSAATTVAVVLHDAFPCSKGR